MFYLTICDILDTVLTLSVPHKKFIQKLWVCLTLHLLHDLANKKSKEFFLSIPVIRNLFGKTLNNLIDGGNNS